MALIPTPNTVKVCLRFTQNGEQTCNVYHVDVGADPDATLLTQVAASFKEWFLGYADAITDQNTTLEAIEATDVSEVDGEGIVYTDGLPLSGTNEGNNMPNNVTLAVKLASGFTGRSRRGRKYLCGINNQMLQADGQRVTDVFRVAVEVVFNQLIQQMVTEGWNLVVNSLISNGVPRVTGLNTPILSAVANGVIDSQRRRLPGRGT